MKTYLYPIKLRRAQPLITAVEKKYDSHWLVTYSELKAPRGYTKKFNGLGREYNRSSSSRISHSLYQAFIKEAMNNRIKFNA